MKPEEIKFLLRTSTDPNKTFVLRGTRYHLADHLPNPGFMGKRIQTLCGKEEYLVGWAHLSDHTLLEETGASICVDCLAVIEP